MDNKLGIIAATALTWGMMADFQLDAAIRPKVRVKRESCLGKAERAKRTAQKKRARKQRRKG